MVNAFKTDGTGLPDFENYNNTEFTAMIILNISRIIRLTLDGPHRSHSGYPWKYNNDIMFEESGSRAPFQYGYFNSMKEQVDPDLHC